VKILASVTSLDEARIVTELGYDILDVKNPAEGSLGAQSPEVIQQIADYGRLVEVPVSVALGDVAFQPGTAALAALGATQFRVRFIKIGLHGTRTVADAAAVLRAIRSAVRMSDSSTLLVAAGYGDYRRFGGLAPEAVVRAAENCGDVVMLDTAIKDEASLFDAMRITELESFVRQAQGCGLNTALAGSIRNEHLPILASLSPDIVGVRGALCGGRDRVGNIELDSARQFIEDARAVTTQPDGHRSDSGRMLQTRHGLVSNRTRGDRVDESDIQSRSSSLGGR
jgi:uncharacterized protein (UPF0264 family)